ncbi:SET domain-containing protein 3 [Conoideocrella luteorostrata]|uniref:SET domain-containing protein 3 n=1 Tax=Conoideocrella luteorostrata TaxID=1105319 RepID=A0AAJ0FZE1_9HYPO|nr:SET domain-containing protein 3 [Conoideocrella luteorostrata]
MESSQQELQALGRTVAGTFKRLLEARWTDHQDSAIPSSHRTAAEEERFRLWARTIGLFQIGHASLDYRVRDASFIKASLTDLLTELQDHVQNLLDIVLDTRPPLEQHEKACQGGETEDDSSCSDDDASLGSLLSSVGSFQEAEFRLSSITTRLDSLYKLASRIRSPRNRQQRSTSDLYKHVPESQRAEYIQSQEQIEISLLQELGFGREELIEQYASVTHWLIARAGMANARRKQQFLYWKKHAQLLGRDVTEEAPAVAVPHPAAAPGQASKLGPAKSTGTSVTNASVTNTSVTKVDLGVMGPEDMRSVISRRSRVSTVASPRGEDLVWPPAPSHLSGSKYFPCPYCGILCPERYLGPYNWRVHQIHDLRPYYCTYEDCSDPGRLYGAKEEWIDHENQHRRVWHCHSHEAEFETQPEYQQHLEEQHPQSHYTPEIIAAVVGASAKPHRDCPFCPTTFSDVAIMQKHVRYHLERLALYALPDIGDDKDDELASERSSDSRQVIENRGRQDSIGNDFVEERQSFLAAFANDDAGSVEPDERMLTSRAHLVSTYKLQGRWKKTEELEVQVIEMRKRVLGLEHPDTLTSMAYLASTYKIQGRWKEAEELEVQVIEMRKRGPWVRASQYADQHGSSGVDV